MRNRISEKDVNNISHYLLENGYVGETTQDENDCFDWNYTKKKKIGDDTEMRSNVSFLKMSDGKFECNISIQIENIEYGCINNGLSASFNVYNDKMCLRMLKELESDFISMLKKYSDE